MRESVDKEKIKAIVNRNRREKNCQAFLNITTFFYVRWHQENLNTLKVKVSFDMYDLIQIVFQFRQYNFCCMKPIN